MSNLKKTSARIAANTLPVYRAYRGYKTAEDLRNNMHHPENRTWAFAGRVAADASTDIADGICARFAGPTRLGGYLDQFADKAWFLAITRQLVLNEEIPERHLVIPTARDVGTLLLRPVAQYYGYDTDAQMSGKIKMWSQVSAVVSACSPLSHEYPEFVEVMFNVATGASVLSGIDMLQSYAHDFTDRHPDQPIARMLANTAVQLSSLPAAA